MFKRPRRLLFMTEFLIGCNRPITPNDQGDNRPPKLEKYGGLDEDAAEQWQ